MPRDSELIFGLREEIVSMTDGLGNFMSCTKNYKPGITGYEGQEYNCKFWIPNTSCFPTNIYKGYVVDIARAFSGVATPYVPIITRHTGVEILSFDIIFNSSILRERFSESKTNRYYKEEMELFKIEFGDKFKV